VAEAADSEAGQKRLVSLYTSDVTDITRLVAHAPHSAQVRVRVV
jgi:hypothetical protein